MEIEKQILTIEQAKHLQSLGLDMSDAALCYYTYSHGKSYIVTFVDNRLKELYGRDVLGQSAIPTYTLQEVLDELPDNISDYTYEKCIDDVWCRVWYRHHRFISEALIDKKSDTFLNAAYEMLCWLLENGYLKND